MKEPKFARLMNKLIGALEDRDCNAEADSLGHLLNARGHWRMTTCKNAEIRREREPNAEPSVVEDIRYTVSEPPEPPWKPMIGEHVLWRPFGTDTETLAVVYHFDPLIDGEVKIFTFEGGRQGVASIGNLRPLKS